jgi:hypothetical protein
MNENLKKGLLVAVIVIAVSFAGWQVTKSMSGEQTHIEASFNMPPGHKSEKEMALEAQAKAGGTPKADAGDSKTQADKEAALAGN